VKVLHFIDFDVDLSAKERAAIRHLLDGAYEVEKVARLTVRISLELAEKLPQVEAPAK
jgi:hypothetical protein